MNRREFLHPRRLAKMAGPVLGSADELEAPPPSSSAAVMLRFARRAMAATFEVIVPFDAPAAHEIAEAALDEIDRLETQLTVYRASSEVSRLNAQAAHHPVRVETNLYELLTQAERIHRGTHGAFDISVGALIKTWGFFRREGRVPSEVERAAVRARIGMQHVLLDPQRHTVFFQRQGIELNLGSIGKGHALDRAAHCSRHTPCAVGPPRDDTPPSDGTRSVPTTGLNMLIHGGHSSILALGNEAPGKTGWTVGLTDPERPLCRRAWIHLHNRAMATSAATHQHFIHEGKKLGHLLDPRTAWPAEGTLSATATAPSAAEADALATAFFILGVEGARAYCEEHPEIGAVMIAADAPRRVVLLGRATEEVDVLR